MFIGMLWELNEWFVCKCVRTAPGSREMTNNWMAHRASAQEVSLVFFPHRALRIDYINRHESVYIKYRSSVKTQESAV